MRAAGDTLCRAMPDTTLIDPLSRRIVLHDRTWWGHIVKFHPDMRGQRPAVESAVRSPLSIHFSASDADCRLYYGQTSNSGVMVAVVADVAAGFVKPAYRTDRAKGAIEWSRSTP